MLRFLRKIRYTLIGTGKSKQYFVYAIGEVLLVVVGILIALQVNNLNEDRKERREELNFLKEILVATEQNRATVAMLLERANDKHLAIPELLDFLSEAGNDLPTFENLYLRARRSSTFAHDRGAYESLKSRGIHVIRNDSLRKEIVKLYELSLPRTKMFFDQRDDVHETQRVGLERQFLTRTLRPDSNDEWSWYFELAVPWTDLISYPAFTEIIALEMRIADNYQTRLEIIDRHLVNLITFLKSEIKQRNA